MAGLYFVAAGGASRNRTKSLDQSLRVDAVSKHLEPRFKHQLDQHFVDDEQVFVWGANKRGNLDKLKQGM